MRRPDTLEETQSNRLSLTTHHARLQPGGGDRVDVSGGKTAYPVAPQTAHTPARTHQAVM
jgi:hypothetical protein